MNTISQIIVYISVFISGFVWGFVVINYFRVRPFLKQHKDLIKALDKANQDNFILVDRLKQLNPFASMQMKEIKGEDAKDFLKALFNEEPKIEEPLFDEKQHLIDELTKMGAVGWSPDDDLKDLKKLYDLL